jgi:hypothetical protein
VNDSRVKAQDLRFHLLERSVHPELFATLRRADVGGPGWSASLVISGQSHIVAVRTERETVTEVVAPSNASLPRVGVRALVPLGRLVREEVLREEGRVRYASVVRVERHAPAAYRDLATRLLARNLLDRRKAFFGDDKGFTSSAACAARDPEGTPFALMDWRCEARGWLEVSSVHACPHELTIVEVESRFEMV